MDDPISMVARLGTEAHRLMIDEVVVQAQVDFSSF
jgi:hypothetical protein